MWERVLQNFSQRAELCGAPQRCRSALWGPGVHMQVLFPSVLAGPAYIPPGQSEARSYPSQEMGSSAPPGPRNLKKAGGSLPHPPPTLPTRSALLSSPPLCWRPRVRGRRRGERTFQTHPHRQALLEAAEGTALALRLVDLAALALGARVVLVVLHRALEEALGERGVSAGPSPRPGALCPARAPPAPRPPPAPASPPRAPLPLTLQLSHVSSP